MVQTEPRSGHQKNKTILIILLIVGFLVLATIGVVGYLYYKGPEILEKVREARMAAQDARRIADIKQLQLALELYYESNEDYPTALSVLVPEFMQQTPNDPLDLGLCRPDYCYAYSSDLKAFHLGTQLEDANYKIEFRDEDFNSKNSGYLGAPFDGAGDMPIFDVISL